LQIENDFTHKNYGKNKVHGHIMSMNHCMRSIVAPKQVDVFYYSFNFLVLVFVDPSVFYRRLNLFSLISLF